MNDHQRAPHASRSNLGALGKKHISGITGGLSFGTVSAARRQSVRQSQHVLGGALERAYFLVRTPASAGRPHKPPSSSYEQPARNGAHRCHPVAPAVVQPELVSVNRVAKSRRVSAACFTHGDAGTSRVRFGTGLVHRVASPALVDARLRHTPIHLRGLTGHATWVIRYTRYAYSPCVRWWRLPAIRGSLSTGPLKSNDTRSHINGAIIWRN